jgi:hypothetical protein
MAPVGRWQQGRDLNWYAKGDDGSKEAEAARIREEKRKLKEAEEDAMLAAMGLPVPVRNNANLTPLGEKAHEADVKGALDEKAKGGDDEAKVERGEKKEKKEKLRGHRDDDGERRRRHRSRSRSRDRERRHRHHRDRSRSRDRRRHDGRDDRRRHRSLSREHRRREERPERRRDRDLEDKRPTSDSREPRRRRETRSRSPYRSERRRD